MKLIDNWGRIKGEPVSTNISPHLGGIAVHYVGGKGKLIGGTHSKCISVVREIQKFHINTNGWSDIAYNLLVCHHGIVFVGRGLRKRSAANGTTSGNSYYYAVCGIINDGETPTKEMLQGIAEACQYLRTKGGAASKVVGHKNLKSTSCPGPLYSYVQKGAFSKKSTAQDNSWPQVVYKVGSSGPNVGKIQKRLNQLGAGLRVDEDFGNKTRDAVMTYQKNHGLLKDGKVGENTWNSLF